MSVTYRDRFHIPRRDDGSEAAYLVGHSLGPQPKAVRAAVEQELASWEAMGVDGYFKGSRSWYRYHERARPALARLVGAGPKDVVAMNGLTVNLHLLMTSFYRPSPSRYKILIDEPTFPSDRYAALSQIRLHGLDPETALLTVGPREGETYVREEDFEDAIARHGDSLALVLLSGVNFLTGQFFDLSRIAQSTHAVGATFGADLAHAVGNVPLSLDAWGVDFAVWCSYKYLNAGPGAVAGAFVHRKYAERRDLQRLAGWWGNDPDTRFAMQLQPEFVPAAGAAGWQLSCPPVLAFAPLLASLEVFDEAGMDWIRERSLALTGSLVGMLRGVNGVEILTPADSRRRGAMVCLRVKDRPRETREALAAAGVVCDFREPDVIRVAPAPLYSTGADVEAFVRVLARS